LEQELINDEENTTKIYVDDIEQINYYISATLKEIKNYPGEITFISQLSDVEMFVPKSTEWYDNLEKFITELIAKDKKQNKNKEQVIEALAENKEERELLYAAHIYKWLAQSNWQLGSKTGEKTKMNFAKIVSQIISSREEDIARKITDEEIKMIYNLIISKSKHYEYNVNSSLSEVLDKHVSWKEQNNIMNDIIIALNNLK